MENTVKIQIFNKDEWIARSAQTVLFKESFKAECPEKKELLSTKESKQDVDKNLFIPKPTEKRKVG